jgi:sugar phosphate isomerase/epimerase
MKMKFGFVTSYTEEIAEFAANAGFDCLEVFVELGTRMDLNKITSREIDEILGYMHGKGLSIGTISCNPNNYDPSRRKENNEYFTKAIKSARKFGTEIVVTGAFMDKSKSPYENIKEFQEEFKEYSKVAESEGVRIAIENCPHWVGYPTPVGNIAFSPEMWDALFDAVPSAAIGLEFDPSHLVWLGIDYLKAIRNFGSRIYAFHAKDTEILNDKLSIYGIIGKQIGKESEWDAGWWRYRIPGFGQVNWQGVFNALYEIKFSGPINIEHEDPVFGGDRSREGLKLGLHFLKKHILGD